MSDAFFTLTARIGSEHISDIGVWSALMEAFLLFSRDRLPGSTQATILRMSAEAKPEAQWIIAGADLSVAIVPLG